MKTWGMEVKILSRQLEMGDLITEEMLCLELEFIP